MSKERNADTIIKTHVLWAMGAGLVPTPLLDVAAVTAIQLDMLKQLADLYGVDYSKSAGKGFVSALVGSTYARLGASLVKAIPGVGAIVGGLSMSALSGASTYAVGQVAIHHFEGEGDLLNLDLDWAKDAYNEAFKRGRQFVSEVEAEQPPEADLFQALEKLGQLKEKGVITEAEFEAQKRKLLDRL